MSGLNSFATLCCGNTGDQSAELAESAGDQVAGVVGETSQTNLTVEGDTHYQKSTLIPKVCSQSCRMRRDH